MKHTTKGEVNNQKDSEKVIDETKDDISNTDEEPSLEAASEGSELDFAKKALDELQAKFDQLNDFYLRTLAEYDNYRKRTLKEKADLIKTGGESVLVNILDVVDDVDRGIASSKMTQDVDALREGMELIHSKFLSFLKQNGIREIEAEGQTFDTDHHEAIATIPAPDESMKGKVIDCVQKGYYLHDKVIRFAKVIVGE
jgi:molecular chaperone GrpE